MFGNSCWIPHFDKVFMKIFVLSPTNKMRHRAWNLRRCFLFLILDRNTCWSLHICSNRICFIYDVRSSCLHSFKGVCIAKPPCCQPEISCPHSSSLTGLKEFEIMSDTFITRECALFTSSNYRQTFIVFRCEEYQQPYRKSPWIHAMYSIHGFQGSPFQAMEFAVWHSRHGFPHIGQIPAYFICSYAQLLKPWMSW